MKRHFIKTFILILTLGFLLSVPVSAQQTVCPKCGDSLSRWEKFVPLPSTDDNYLTQHMVQYYYICYNYKCNWGSGVVEEETVLKNHSILSAGSQTLYKDKNKSVHATIYMGTCFHCKASQVYSQSYEEKHLYGEQSEKSYVKKDAKYHKLVEKKICRYCGHEDLSTLKTASHSFKWKKSGNKFYNICSNCGYSRANTAVKAKKVTLKLPDRKTYTIKLDNVSKYDSVKKVTVASKYCTVVTTTTSKVKIKTKTLPSKAITLKVTMKSGKIYEYAIKRKK